MSLSPQGEYLPLESVCRGTAPLQSCQLELSVSRALVKSRLGRDLSKSRLRIARSRDVGPGSLRLTSSGRELLRLQPGGLRVQLSLSAVSRSGRQASSTQRLRLRLDRSLALPGQVFRPGQAVLDPAGERALSSLSENLPSRVAAVTCTGYRARVQAPERPRGRRAARRFRAMLSAYQRRLRQERQMAAGRARVACGQVAAKSRKIKLASGGEGVSMRLSYPRPAVDSLPDLGLHSMIQPGMSEEELSQTMAAAREAGMDMVRFDLPVNYIGQYTHVYPGMYDFSFLDMVRRHAQQHQVKLLAIATWAPQLMTECGDDYAYRCPPRDPVAWAELLKAAAAHAPEIDHYEIWNEPNTRFFRGSQEQYVAILRAAYSALKSQSPDNQVVIGGPASIGAKWLGEVLPQVSGSYDIASVHVRPSSSRAGKAVDKSRRIFKQAGFEGPLWITEMGYPSDDDFQYDKLFRGGQEAQADYYSRALSEMERAGVDKVFITGRDGPEFGEDSPFRSEGLWGFEEGSLRFKAAYWRLAEAG